MGTSTQPVRTIGGRMLRRSLDSIAPAPVASARNSLAGNPQVAAIRAAREASEIALGELLHRSDDALTAEEVAKLQPEIELARFTVNDCRQKEIDLLAAGSVIPTLDAAILDRLQSLADSLDSATVRNAVTAATIDGLAAILNSAVRITAML